MLFKLFHSIDFGNYLFDFMSLINHNIKLKKAIPQQGNLWANLI